LAKKILYINKRILNTREKELKVKTEELNMSTNFEKLNMWNVTDRNALFIVGTKRDKMEHLENSLFCHPLRKFDRTDKNKNGVIDADELLSRLKKERAGDIAVGILEALSTAAWGTLAVMCLRKAKPIGSPVTATLGVLCFGGAIEKYSDLLRTNRNIKILKEYIKLQEAENASA